MTRFFLLMTTCAALASPALAEFQLSVYSGAQSASHSVVTGTYPDSGDNAGEAYEFVTGWDGNPWQLPPYWGVRATWWQSDNWGYGLDFTHSKLYANYEAWQNSNFTTLEFTDGLNNLTANVYYKFDHLVTGRYRPYIGLGAGVLLPHVEAQTSGGGELTFDYQFGGLGGVALAGFEYELNDKWALFGEYKLYYNMIDVTLNTGGSLATNVIAHAVNLGVSRSF